MTNTDLYRWHSLAVIGDTDEKPSEPQCGWYLRKKRGDATPSIIFSDGSGLSCYVGKEKVKIEKFWPLLRVNPITEKFFVGSNGHDPRARAAPSSNKAVVPEFKTFDGEEGLLPYVADFVSRGQKWTDVNNGISDRETAHAAGVWLKKSRALAAMLNQFKGHASDKQYEQMMGQLQTVADAAKLIIAPWVIEHDGEEIAGLNKDNVKVVKERYAKIEDLDLVVKHYLEKRHKILISTLEKMCNYDAKRNRKVPGMKVLIREVTANAGD